MPSFSSTRRLRVIGYLFMAMLLVMQVVDLAVRASPFRLHSPAWRLALVGTSAGAMPGQLLALFVIFAIALLAEDRTTSFVVALLSALSGVFCLVALGSFSLDALQIKNEVQASLADKYDAGTIWVIVKLVIGTVLFLVLTVASWRTAKGVARHRAAAGTPARSSWLLSPARPSTPVATPTQPTAEAKTR